MLGRFVCDWTYTEKDQTDWRPEYIIILIQQQFLDWYQNRQEVKTECFSVRRSKTKCMPCFLQATNKNNNKNDSEKEKKNRKKVTHLIFGARLVWWRWCELQALVYDMLKSDCNWPKLRREMVIGRIRLLVKVRITVELWIKFREIIIKLLRALVIIRSKVSTIIIPIEGERNRASTNTDQS